ncbi:alanine racemase [Erwiniaceae bacterium L1_55_4]|nr:alanine racemase [Erwiniaceae bacterium L1_55_4]
MPRPVKAEIDLSAMRNNLSIVSGIASHSKVWAVIKADAYGHGIENILPALSQANGLALLDFEEAVRVRKMGWTKPILLLEGFFHSSDLIDIERFDLCTAVHSEWQLKAIEDFSPSTPINVYLKINTGMNRLGFSLQDALDICHKAKSSRHIGSVTLMSHFARADEKDGVAEPAGLIENLALGTGLQLCMANSAATLWHAATRHDWVRPGVVLYGASPTGVYSDIAEVGLRPVMKLKSEIIGLQHLRPGDAVGYGARYRAVKNETIGIVACGYADGYPRQAPSGTPVWVGDRMTHTCGTISMDMLAVSLTGHNDLVIGTEVELWGDNVRVDTVASQAGTLGYELLSAVTPRVKRILTGH